MNLHEVKRNSSHLQWKKKRIWNKVDFIGPYCHTGIEGKLFGKNTICHC